MVSKRGLQGLPYVLVSFSNPWTSWRWTCCLFKKFQNAIFQRILRYPFKKMLLQWVQNLTIFFFLKYLESSKVLAEMGCDWQADWATAKIFFSNLRTHEINKCWKFQADILIHVWFRAKRLKICYNQWTHIGQHESIWPIWVHWLQ